MEDLMKIRPALGPILFILAETASMLENAPTFVFGQGADFKLLIKRLVGSGSNRLKPLLAIGVVVLLFLTSLSSEIRSVRAERVAPAAAGDLDTSFGSGGTVSTQFFGLNDQANAVVLQPDGKIVAAGVTLTLKGNQDSNRFAVARYNTDGSLDTTFGNGGEVTTDFLGFYEECVAVALQPDGKIVAAGTAATRSTSAGVFPPDFDDSEDFAVARYNTDGSLDAAFGNGGKVTTDFLGFEDLAYAVAIQPDGDIVVAGGACRQTISGGNVLGEDFAMARYNSAGSLDTTFGKGGKVTVDFAGLGEFATSVALQSDGKIVLSGDEQAGTLFPVFGLARCNPDGTLDTTFGLGGKVLTPFSGLGDNAICMAIQQDGEIVVAGDAVIPAGDGSSTNDLAIARYNTNGSLDTSFGSFGTVTTFFPGSLNVGGAGNVIAIALQPDGKIVVAANPIYPVPGSQNLVFGKFALGRYNPDGSLDTTFGSGGFVTTELGSNATANAIAVQPDAKIVAAGVVSSASGTDFALARYLAGPIAGDFSVTATPPSQTISAGQSATYTINVESPSGADSGNVAPEATSVNLSATVSPSTTDITTSFDENSVGLPGSSTLSVATTKATPLGTYNIAVTSTNGSATEVTNITLIVSGPDFSLSVAQSTITVPPGTKAPVVVSINRVGGDTGKVTVTPPTAPAGIKVKPPSPISTTGNSAAFKLKITASAGAGSYQFTFTGTDTSGHTHSATLTLVVQ
jgi:uncharacterized delta-60 repeat protein